jgi:hypothetical protein
MLTKIGGFGVLALTAALTLGAAAPASAEFFGCNDNHRASYSTRSYSTPSRTYTRYSAPHRSYATSRYTNEFAAQSSRRLTYSTHRSSRYYSNWR